MAWPEVSGRRPVGLVVFLGHFDPFLDGDDLALGLVDLLHEAAGGRADVLVLAVPALERAVEANRPGTRRGDSHLGGAALNALRKINAAKTREEQR